jgi:hypothetical protein
VAALHTVFARQAFSTGSDGRGRINLDDCFELGSALIGQSRVYLIQGMRRGRLTCQMEETDMIDNHAIHFIKLGKSLGAFMIASIGLVLIAGATTRVNAGMLDRT